MPQPTPFHPRTSALCTSLSWKEWAGYHAVRTYDVHHAAEYHALRGAAALLDVSPLQKVDVRGADAARLLGRILLRDPARLAEGRVAYTAWCDDDGGVLDDGTVTCLGPERFRLTSAEPALAWLARHADGLRVELDDVTDDLGALALQGPRAREVLLGAVEGAELAGLRPFRAAEARCDGAPLLVTRTGYTGDLGYELWVRREHALRLWDALVEAGRPHRMLPMGLDALDVARIEAGYLLGGVDYVHAHHAELGSQASSPFELDLGWMVDLERRGWIGRDALAAEARAGSRWRLVRVELDAEALEELFHAEGLAPCTPDGAWRDPVPMYAGGEQVGWATSGAFSPLLKRHLAIATVDAARAGSDLRMEVTVDHRRRSVPVRVSDGPLLDPSRRTAS